LPKKRDIEKDCMTTSTQQNTLQFDVNKAGIVTLWLDSGERPVVILDRELIQRLNFALDAIDRLDKVNGLILRSSCERVFVAGADLAEIDRLDDPGLHSYLAFGTTVFGRISSMDCPTVACINGATLGGGLELAMHCDILIASKTTKSGKPYPIGLPEAGLGLCPGWGGSQMLPARIDPVTAIKATASGTPFMISDLPDGLVYSFVETPDDLQSAAESIIQNISSHSKTPRAITTSESEKYSTALEIAKAEIESTEAAKGVFLAVTIGIQKGWSAAVAIEQCELVRLRNTHVAREKLDAFLSKG
jgi:enoyl-CoA hydratase